jgi:hypothetical protein
VAGLIVTFLSAAIANTRELYRREPLPRTKSSLTIDDCRMTIVQLKIAD